MPVVHNGMEIIGGNTPPNLDCEPCIKGKQACTEIRKETDTLACADEVLGHQHRVLHSYVGGKYTSGEAHSCRKRVC
jgi:hypothetical protein